MLSHAFLKPDIPSMYESTDPHSDLPGGEPAPVATPETSAPTAAQSTMHEESLGERSDGAYKTTFHVFKNQEQVCYYLERIYDLNGKMVRMVKRSADGRSETRFDPASGDIERIFEAYTLPDGNHLSKEKRYLELDCTTESVLVVCPRGGLVRAVMRESVGLVNVFQGQTEFAPEGYATVSINHWFDAKTSKMKKREQIQWLPGGERGVTEHFHFSDEGTLLRYNKILYHPGTDRFLEENHIYEPRTQTLRRKEIKTYGRFADLADMEVTIFDAKGFVVETAKNVVPRAPLARHS